MAEQRTTLLQLTRSCEAGLQTRARAARRSPAPGSSSRWSSLDYSNYVWMGRAAQCVLVDQSQFAAGAEITVPLGGAATGVFKVDGCLATSGLRTAWRKG